MLHLPGEVESAIEHLKQTPLAQAIATHPVPTYELSTDPYQFLTRAIIFQQLSTKAATTIYNRFQAKVQSITPESVLKFSCEELREVGVSRQKASYILDLASKVQQKIIHPDNWITATEDVVREEITSVKGLGPWSADMFCIFALAKPDIWPITDQGIKNGIRNLMGQESHLPEPELIAFGNQFQPYRSVAAHYLWRIVDSRTC